MGSACTHHSRQIRQIRRIRGAARHRHYVVHGIGALVHARELDEAGDSDRFAAAYRTAPHRRQGEPADEY